MKSIYTTYKERLIEISGKSRSIYSRKGTTRFSNDLVELFGCNEEIFKHFINNLWKGNEKPFDLLTPELIKKIYDDSGMDSSLKNDAKYQELLKKSPDEAKKYLSRMRNKEIKKIIDDTVRSFSQIKKEITDIARETGKYELYVGYPFVYGSIAGESIVKAPLILFPVKINIVDDSNVSIELIKDMPVTLNKALLFNYARERKLNIDDLNMEFNEFNKSFRNVNDVLEYLKKNHIRIAPSSDNNIATFDSSGVPNKESTLRIKNHCVVGRYPLANSIYIDYNELEKKKAPTNGAINELIYAQSPNKNKKAVRDSELYTIHKLDFTQEQAIEKINNDGNMVIYGPPGTGKSQTIVNIITDALARNKRVLVVSQKKAALDVVYNRLGKVKKNAMLIIDPEKEREAFYKQVYSSHQNVESYDCSEDLLLHHELEKKINKNLSELEKVFAVLYETTEFGVNLETMYEQSSQISKNSYDYQIYEKLIKRNDLLKVKYDQLVNSLENINQNKRRKLYYEYASAIKKNVVLENIKDDLDVYTIDTVVDKLEKVLANGDIGFNLNEYDYGSYLISHYIYNINKSKINLDDLVTLIARQENKKGVLSYTKFEKELKENFEKGLKELKEETKQYEFLKEVLDEKGYQIAIGAILNGNTTLVKNLKQALNNYTSFRDIKLELSNLEKIDREILNFAYKNSDTAAKYNQILDNFMAIRMYIEIVKLENERKEDLAKIMSFNSIKNDILSLKKKQFEVANRIASNSFNDMYINNFNKNRESKNYLYQITKQQNSWPIRKFMKEYYGLMMDLYPCWLLSPENVSTIMPLIKDMFDIVLFDEASQVFIENTLPIIYRGKNVVIAGDAKQLKPTATFMKRYLGSDVDENIDPTTEAALEVDSLLDLATSRLPSTNLNYHYRSRNQELIDFSNQYFYENKLEIVPNLVGNRKNNAITRVKVNGKWIDRRNEVEAKTVVEILKKAFAGRKNNESIGIITFNSEQSYAIEEEIRRECKINKAFAEAILKERNRFENNEDISLFIKNLENVQGDERDIIILSVGYAPNETGRIFTNFGSLSTEGGENRLNVAITRAKERIFVVTSIEPEDLKVEKAKNEGPKILKKYLSYVRAVSNKNQDEVKIWLNSKKESEDKTITIKDQMALEIKEELEELGYHVDVKVGNTKRKIDLAVYDEDLDSYLLGIECINKDYKNMDEMIENQMYHVGFLESRGWKIHHVWTRDWWMSKTKVINSIVKDIERVKANYSKNLEKTPKKKII